MSTRFGIVNNVYAGTPLPGLLFVVLLVLKLTGFIDWSWWWVTAPLWVLLAAVLILVGIWLAVLALIAMFGSTRKRR